MLVGAGVGNLTTKTFGVALLLALAMPALASLPGAVGGNQCGTFTVSVSPPSATVAVGAMQSFDATVMCDANDVTAQSQIDWSLVSTSVIGKISPVTGPKTTFYAMAAGQGEVVAAAVYFDSSGAGVKGMGRASVVVGGGSAQCPVAVLKVDVAPSSASMQVGDQLAFTATVWCGTQDVTSQATIGWMVTVTIGTVNPPSGPKTLFTAMAPGTGDLVASASIPSGQQGRGFATITVGGGGGGCNSISVSVSPPSATLAVGATQAFGATVMCGTQDVTSASTIAWTVNGGVGSVSPTSGPKTMFTATTPGSGAVMADASYQGSTGSGSASVTVVGGGATCSKLSVYVKPQNVYTFVGVQTQFGSMVDCDGKDVTSAASIVWSAVGGIGSLANPSGPTTTFLATAPGYGGIIATASFGGQSASGGARITVAPQNGLCLSMVVVLTPSQAMMKVGDMQRFEARVYCGGVDVTGQATITWGVLGGIGTVAPSSGPGTDFTATSSGQGAVAALASLGGVDAIAYAKVLVA
jgi:hypothetical protein